MATNGIDTAAEATIVEEQTMVEENLNSINAAWLAFERVIKHSGGNLFYLRNPDSRYTGSASRKAKAYVWSSEANAQAFLEAKKLGGYEVSFTSIESWIEYDVVEAAEANQSIVVDAGTDYWFEAGAVSAKASYYSE